MILSETKYLGAGFGLTGAAMSQPYYIPGTTSRDRWAYNRRLEYGHRAAARTAAGRWRHERRWRSVTCRNRFRQRLRAMALRSPPRSLSTFGATTTAALPIHSSRAPVPTPQLRTRRLRLLRTPSLCSRRTGLDSNSFSASPSASLAGHATDSYYRVAIAAGKSIPFPQPAWGGAGLRHRRWYAQLPALSGRSRRHQRLLRRIADQHVLFAIRDRQLQVL